MSNFRLILNNAGLQSLNAKSYILPRNRLVSNRSEYAENKPSLGTGGANYEVADITEQVDEANAISVLGTPVFSNLVLQSQDASVILRIDAVLMTVSMTKNIVKTKVQGQNGTFKEYVSDGDYKVGIKGVLASTNPQVYPRNQVQRLKALCDLAEPIEASSDFLDLFGVHNLVIERYQFPQKEGFYNMQGFSLSCVSDEPLELLL